jgi:DNA-binding GntR family transcriptional regulator
MASPAVGDPRETIASWVAGQLRTEIRSGALTPGTRLRHLELAERFNVSTTPVRDALRTLQREGLVTGSPHRGLFVFHPQLDDLIEAYDIRIALESTATEKAVPNLTADDLADLRATLDELGKITYEESQRYYELNARFHRRIYAAAARPRLLALIEELRDASAAYQILFQAYQRTANETQAEHEAIYEACAAHDAKRAGELMAKHLHHTVAVVSSGLQSETS